MTTRQLQAMATKSKILEEGEKIVLEKGSFDVAVEDIAARCGVSKGTIYHYFPSKDALLLQISQSFYRSMKADFAATQGKASYLERLKGFVRNWFLCINTVAMPLAMDNSRFLADVGKNRENKDDSPSLENGLEILRECVQGAMAAGELRADTPVEALSLEIIFSLHGAALHKQKYDTGFDLLSWARMFADTILPGLLAEYLP